jgi:hypothetical protein
MEAFTNLFKKYENTYRIIIAEPDIAKALKLRRFTRHNHRRKPAMAGNKSVKRP